MGSNVLNTKEELDGYKSFTCVMPVKLLSKSNYRIDKKNWKSLKKFEELISYVVREKIPADWSLGSIEESLVNRPQIIVSIIAHTKIDNGNTTKSLFDGLEGVVYHNDASIISTHTLTIRENREPLIAIGFAMISNGEVARILESQSKLNLETLEAYEGFIEKGKRDLESAEQIPANSNR